MGFIAAAKATETANEITNESETSWFPINPADTKLFGVNLYPYKRIGKNGLTSHLEIANLLLIRGMTFLGYNSKLTDDEIKGMAEIDTMSMIYSIDDITLKLALSSNLTIDKFLALEGKINGKEGGILSPENTDFVYYCYFPAVNGCNEELIMPISDGFSGDWIKNTDGIWEFPSTEPAVFLTNYNIGKVGDYKYRPLDGAVYVKIFIPEDFVDVAIDNRTTPENVNFTNNLMVLSGLKVNIDTAELAKNAGFNFFSGKYGIQDFVNMNWGTDDLKDLPLRYVFFDEISVINDTKNSINTGLFWRESKDSKTIYDLGCSNETNDIADFVYNTAKTAYFESDTTNRWSSHGGKGSGILDPVFTEDLQGKNWLLLNKLDASKTSYPFVDLKFRNKAGLIMYHYNYSLFGSRFYYGQSLSKYPLYAKAFLFLNSLPLKNIEENEIYQLFAIRSGFVHVPKLWAAYIGSLLWRWSSQDPIIDSNGYITGGGSGKNDPIVFKKSNLDILPPCNVTGEADAASWVGPDSNHDISDLSADNITQDKYKAISYAIFSLPQQAQEEFKKIFFNFVKKGSVSIGSASSDYDFETLNNMSQLVSDGSIITFDKKLDILYTTGNIKKTSKLRSYGYIPTELITKNFDNVDKYQWVIPVAGEMGLPRQLGLMFKGVGSDNLNSPVGMIVNMITEEVIIGNTGYNTWGITNSNSGDSLHQVIYDTRATFNIYFNKVIEIIKAKCSTNAIAEDIKQYEQQIFGTSDTEAIKFQLYKTCKNINDKWLGSVDNVDNIIYQCGGGKNSVDTASKEKHRKGDPKYRLIDSFRFLDRSFHDIGDLFYMDPVPVNDYLMNSPNTSMFDAISQLLASNHFTFIPLPTFINYKEEKTLKAMFDTYPNYDEAIEDGICGPSFISVYAGDSSKHLDYGDNEYPSDGIDFQCDSNGNISTKIPADFVGTSNAYENDVAVFSVNYSQQNQNIFKDITLDQSEFAETDESLKITDNIAHKGTENNVSLGGQNIFNVYAVRSYKAEVEMMGNAMIQPMMHFQLNNIPMFHGAYLITRVKHSIKPNFMSTVFSGSRVRYQKTDLLTGADFYMGILDSMNLSANASSTTGTVGNSGSVPPIVATISQNDGVPSNIDGGSNKNITMTAIPEISGIRSQISGNKGKNRLLTEAVAPLKEMLTAWVDWMISSGFTGYVVGKKRYYGEITSAYRTYQQQADAGANASKGISNHQWGIAVDIKMSRKDGTLIEMQQNLEEFKITNNPALEWLLNNSWKYGFIIPYGMRDGKGGYNEFWHFEYHGTAAVCLIKKDPTTYGGHVVKNINVNDVKPVVVNPKGVDNKPANYGTTCDYIYIKGNQGTVDNGPQIDSRLIYEELKTQLGYGDEGIAGVMGNLYQESRFKPEAQNPAGDYGLAQWTSVNKNTRKQEFLDYMTKNNLDKS
jgi:LAS superfamily LD-carboxypeptidase LdcB